MITLIKRLVRHLRGACLTCGAEPIEGCAHCWDCSLRIVEDWDETKAIELAERYVSLKPAYHEDDDDDSHWAEDDHYSCGDKS
ncbi:hypothetical protein LCGC14_2330420 [marine sediment metagenome]|uniref:Uncharacterized protein n=1 Tax=marine sediment metagenome TaxID=412755 RepID=A0A0F9CF00_9ZZZZ